MVSMWRECEHGARVSTCYHTPRCGPLRPGQPLGSRPFGRHVAGPADDVWRVRQPDGEIVGWGLTEEGAGRLAAAWAGDVAERDPLGVPSTEPYPPGRHE